ncbi:uncharacterized protein LOC133729971 [Rosa rugosa]|uniref:uncharacterized protein LOC133729971 n=1 Tax=Rosa rugosa TaxID=74645 RepID=UPI002B40E6C2|nr:uncharacterized protein LOC133729971 [Rosa rugosa]XP_062013578.1 uncharacterized protein LOC133729971 [Rosa rugosa]
MKKLYRRGTVHPSPPTVSDHLSFLPATILALAAALSPRDREVLAYLISCSNTNNVNLTSSPSSRKTTTTTATNSSNKKSSAAKGGGGSGGRDHPARFNCSCFRCYTSYWVRWDESPNRELIHDIIDAFEDELLSSQSGSSSSSKAAGSKYGKKDKRHHNKRGNSGNGPGQGSELSLKKKDQMVKPNMVEETNSSSNSTDSGDLDGDEESKGSVRRFVSFLGERIWGGVWSQ